MEMLEIESKERAILEIKRIRQGLTKEEQYLKDMLEEKCREKSGRLKVGAYFINSNGKWEGV